jgi:hypothetical protein
VTLEIRCIDRVLLTFRQPRLQYGQGIHGFFCYHRANQFVSSALMRPMTERFAADIRHYITADDGADPGQVAQAEQRVGCGGTLTQAQHRALLLSAGFTAIAITSTHQAGAGLHSAIIEVAKPAARHA